jgi:hypothetical protein
MLGFYVMHSNHRKEEEALTKIFPTPPFCDPDPEKVTG